MILLRACPRCGGDLIREEFLGEAELVCLQCGYRVAIAVPGPVLAGRRLTRVR